MDLYVDRMVREGGSVSESGIVVAVYSLNLLYRSGVVVDMPD